MTVLVLRKVPMVSALVLLRRILRVAALVVAGVAVAFVTLETLGGLRDDNSDTAPSDRGLETWQLVGLFLAAGALLGLAYGVSLLADHAERYVDVRRAAAARASDDELADEAQREIPRLARQYGRAKRAPTEDDPIDV